MNLIRSFSKFHNIGQGLFYSGYFSIYQNENSRVDYVIDCGSEDMKYLNNALTEYIDDLCRHKKGMLDVLILSHLHEDHISGLEKLCRAFRIKRVILPYLDPIERLVLYLENKSKLEWYADFIINPTAFFRKYHVDEIVYIDENDDRLEKNTNVNNRPDPQFEFFINRDGLNISIGKMQRDFALEDNVKKIDPEILNITGGDKRSLQVSLLKEYSLIIYGVIEFDFFVKKLKTDVFKKFKRNVSKIIGVKPLIDAINNESKRIQIINEYNKLPGNFNNTSLCNSIVSYGNHRIYNYKCNAPIECFDERCILACHCCKRIDRFGYIFTGDICLAPAKSGSQSGLCKDFISHYKSKAEKINVFVVPHHGSTNNWDAKLMEVFNAEQWVVSAAIKNNIIIQIY